MKIKFNHKREYWTMPINEKAFFFVFGVDFRSGKGNLFEIFEQLKCESIEYFNFKIEERLFDKKLALK